MFSRMIVASTRWPSITRAPPPADTSGTSTGASVVVGAVATVVAVVVGAAATFAAFCPPDALSVVLGVGPGVDAVGATVPVPTPGDPVCGSVVVVDAALPTVVVVVVVVVTDD